VDVSARVSPSCDPAVRAVGFVFAYPCLPCYVPDLLSNRHTDRSSLSFTAHMQHIFLTEIQQEGAANRPPPLYCYLSRRSLEAGDYQSPVGQPPVLPAVPTVQVRFTSPFVTVILNTSFEPAAMDWIS
jgi:hypothetical protein